MEKRTLISIIFFTLLIFMAGCAMNSPAGHKYIMRGQVLEINNNVVYLCIGSNDGASVGQELTVVKFDKIPVDSQKYVGPIFKREETGKVKILEIVDEHYAKATLLSGEVEPHYTVELKK